MTTTLYIAGPMTDHPNYNRPAFHHAAAELRAAGYHVISPAETPQPCPNPGWVDWARASIKRMLDADHLALLPGWENSRGATLEFHTAHQLDMDCRTIDQWIYAAGRDPTIILHTNHQQRRQP